jgi:hypothetical protein
MSWIVRLATVRLAAPSTGKGPPINTIRPCNTEFDATVFGFAPNKANQADALAGPVLSAVLSATEPRRGAKCRGPLDHKALKKIQAIYNEKCTPIAMQGLVRPREKPLAQEQWETMEKQCEEQWKQSAMQARAYIGVTPDARDGAACEVATRRSLGAFPYS